MRKGFCPPVALLGCAALSLISLSVSRVPAAEPAREFLQALRDAGYHDMAVEYLNRMETSPLAPVELKEVLLYEKGATLIQASHNQRDIAIRQKQLDEARQALDTFIRRRPDHPLVSSANNQLGNLLVERARIGIEQAKKPGADRQTLLAEARGVYDQAYKVFDRAKAELREKLSTMKVVAPDDRKKLELRDRLRADYLQAQLLAAAIKEEMADTAEPGSDPYRTLLTDAAAQYAEIYEKYRTRLAGLYARMYQARCLQKLGDDKTALAHLGELLGQPDNPEEFRTLKTKSMLLAIDCWERGKLYAEAVEKLDPWIDGARPMEAKTPNWLKLRLALARAQWTQAQELKKTNPRDPQVRRLERDARGHATFVSKIAGDLQQDARQLLADWGGPKIDSTQKPKPTTFAEALQAGRDALDALQTANLVLKTVPDRIASETDDAVKQQLQTQLDDARQTAGTAMDEAKQFFRLALRLADRDTDVRDVNTVRYYLSFLCFATQQYYDAAVIGEFLARRYPDSVGARQGAKIAMAAYVKLYTQLPSENKQFEKDRVVAVANYIAQKWPDQPEAVEALNTLIPFMIQAGDLDGAVRYLDQIPESSPKRGEAEIKIGQAMWSLYLTGMQDVRRWQRQDEPVPEGVDIDAKKAELDQLKARAQSILAAGVARLRAAGAAGESGVTAALSLAQIYVDAGEVQKAIELLEEEKIGPLALVRAGHESTDREGFRAEVYKTALRAYISSLAGSSSADATNATIQKATGVMEEMKQAIAQKQLIAIYVSLARDLEKQMKLASPQAKQALSKGFDTFLVQLRSSATDVGVLNWVAETFFSLGSGFDTEGKVTPDAIKYYKQAADTYQTMLDKAKAGGLQGLDEPKMLTQIRLRLATAKRKLNTFTEARDLLKTVLQENEMMLDVQVEAATLYQQWADVWLAQQKPDNALALYEKALRGAEPTPDTGKNVIWGWGRMFQITARYPQFRNTFHEARYNLALCRYGQARAMKAKKEKTKEVEYLEKAKKAILQTQQLYGTGAEWNAWQPRYEALIKNVQRALGERPVGLPESKAAEVATAGAANHKP